MLSRQEAIAVRTLSVALSKIIPDDLAAKILEYTVSAEADPNLTDREADLARRFHEEIADIMPEALDAAFAMTGRPPVGE